MSSSSGTSPHESGIESSIDAGGALVTGFVEISDYFVRCNEPRHILMELIFSTHSQITSCSTALYCRSFTRNLANAAPWGIEG